MNHKYYNQIKDRIYFHNIFIGTYKCWYDFLYFLLHLKKFDFSRNNICIYFETEDGLHILPFYTKAWHLLFLKKEKSDWLQNVPFFLQGLQNVLERGSRACECTFVRNEEICTCTVQMNIQIIMLFLKLNTVLAYAFLAFLTQNIQPIKKCSGWLLLSSAQL